MKRWHHILLVQPRRCSATALVLQVQLGTGVKTVAIFLALCTATVSAIAQLGCIESRPGTSQSAVQRLLLDVAALPVYDEYSWMWGDAGKHLLGHGAAEMDLLRWSEWKNSAATIRDLEAYRDTESFNRPVEVMGTEGAGRHIGLHPRLQDLTRTKMTFASPNEAIQYLKMHRRDYSWMWGDAGTNLFGHGIAEIDPFRWSDWESADSMIKELSDYRRPETISRPVEIKKEGDSKMMFRNVKQAIMYLEREENTAAQFSAPLSTLAPESRLSSVLEGSAPETSPPSTGPTGPLGPASMARDPTGDAAESSLHLTDATVHLLLAILAATLLACCGCLGCLCTGKRSMQRKRGQEATDRESSEEEAVCDRLYEDDGHQKDQSSAQRSHRAFPGALTNGELRRLLEEVEQEEPIRALPSSSSRTDPERRAEAACEVERILATRDVAEIFGEGTAVQQNSEYRRLVRMLHPDKGLVSGERATLALRLVVEYHSMTPGSPHCYLPGSQLGSPPLSD